MSPCGGKQDRPKEQSGGPLKAAKDKLYPAGDEERPAKVKGKPLTPRCNCNFLARHPRLTCAGGDGEQDKDRHGFLCK